MEINWMVVIYFVIGLFALGGFLRGWWKEAITTFILAILVALLQFPDVAQWLINRVNDLLRTIWDFLPDSFIFILEDFLETVFGVTTAGRPLQTDPSNAGTWLIILILFLALAILVGRIGLRRDLKGKGGGRYYPPTFIGSVLGALLGALNGFIIIGLVREYLDGRALPGGGGPMPPSEITLAGSSSFGVASSGISIQAVELPRLTILDSFVPWVVIIAGVLILIAAINTRFSRDGLNVSAKKKTPFGYGGYNVKDVEPLGPILVPKRDSDNN